MRRANAIEGFPIVRAVKALGFGTCSGLVVVIIAGFLYGLCVDEVRSHSWHDDVLFNTLAGTRDSAAVGASTDIAAPAQHIGEFLRAQKTKGNALDVVLQHARELSAIMSMKKQEEMNLAYSEVLGKWKYNDEDGKQLQFLVNNESFSGLRKDKDRLAQLQRVYGGEAPPVYDHFYPTFTWRFPLYGFFFVQFCATLLYLSKKSDYNRRESSHWRWYQLSVGWFGRTIYFLVLLPGGLPLLSICVLAGAFGALHKRVIEVGEQVMTDRVSKSGYVESSRGEEQALLESMRHRLSGKKVAS